MVSSEPRHAVPPDDAGPLAIICGGGSLPLAVADVVARRGRRVVLFPVRGFADPAVERYPHHWVALGQFGRLFGLIRTAGCRDVVLLGALVRPRLTHLRLDWTTIRAWPLLKQALRGGDDHLLTSVARLFEANGFRLVGAHEAAPDILLPEGQLGARAPEDRDRRDIEHGLALLDATGPFDVGQSAVVADRHVLAVEAVEGTDRMIERIATLRRDGLIRAAPGSGVLIKAPKRGQDKRFDLPSIGPHTVELVAQAGLAGIAAVAGWTIVAEPDAVARLADTRGVFVVGIKPTGGGA